MQRTVFTFFNRKDILYRLALIVILIVGGSSFAWADDVFTLTFEELSGTDAPSGWTGSDIRYENNYLRGTANYTTYYLTSNSVYSIANGQRIVITAKSLNTSSAKVGIFFSTSSESQTFPSKANKEFTTEIRQDTNNDYELTYVNTSDRTCYLKFLGYYTLIKKIEVKAALPELTSINESVDPGEFKSNTPSSITIKYTANAGWNTICMPIRLRDYSVNHLNSIFGTDWKAYTLSNYSNGVLTFASIAASGYVNANIPLLVYAPNATGEQSSLVLSSTAVSYSATPSATAGDAVFQGTYAPKTFTDANEDGIDDNGTWYGVTPSGSVMKAGSGASIKGYRAYFTGVSAPTNGARVSIVIEDDNGGTTDLSFTRMVDPDAKDVYTLSGQKVQRGSKGIYIVNGRKVVIK